MPPRLPLVVLALAMDAAKAWCPVTLAELLASGDVKAALILKGDFTDRERDLIQQAWEAGLGASDSGDWKRLALDMGALLRAATSCCYSGDAEALLARLDGITNKDKTT